VRLTDEERAMLAGEHGDAARASLESQIAVGGFFGAERLVEVENAHVMGDWDVMGAAGRAYLERLVAVGGRVAVPTTRNPGAVDFAYAERLRQSKDLLDGERRVRELLSGLGIDLVDTCIGYQTIPTPRFGDHVAWGDTGAAIYANAVLGARTNFESGPAAIAAAITGRTPAYGFHLEQHRAPSVRCHTNLQPGDHAEWGALGAVIGARLQDYWAVPVLEGLDQAPSPDALKHLGASLASYGSLAMFHIPGVTPEADAIDPAAVASELTVDAADVDAIFAAGAGAGDPVDVVVFTAPQLSLAELAQVRTLLDGRRVHPQVTLLATTNAIARDEALRTGDVEAIELAGGLVLQGTCWYLMAPGAMGDSFRWRRLVTNSAKLINIIKAHSYQASLRSTEACIEAAVTGRLPAP
jgi:predicted aconitase